MRAAHDSALRSGSFDGWSARWMIAGALGAMVCAGCGGGSDASTTDAAPSIGTTGSAPMNPAGPAVDDAGTVSGPDDGALVTRTLATEALQRLNEARAATRDCGDERFDAATALTWNTGLEQAAFAHAEWMQATDTVSHSGADGSNVASRVDAVGYRWQSVGENIAAGQADVAAVITGWLASPGHCRNVMNPAFLDTALALKPGTSANQYRSYWVLVLARPR